MDAYGLGRRLRDLRDAKGLTQKQLADRTGLSAIFIRKLEAGERLPSLPVLEQIAAALGARVSLELRPRRLARGGQHGR